MKFFLIPLILLTLKLNCGAITADEIVQRAVEADKKNQELSETYIYEEKIVSQVLDKKGNISKSREKSVLVAAETGISYEFIPGDDGDRLLIAGTTVKTDALTSNDIKKSKAKKLKNPVKLYTESMQMQDLAAKYDFALEGEETVNGVATYRLAFKPKTQKTKEKSKADKVMNHLMGTLWISKSDYAIVSCSASLAKAVNMAWFFARIRDVDLHYNAHRLPSGVWMPKDLTLYFNSRSLVFGNYQKQTATMSGFRVLQKTTPKSTKAKML